MKQYVYGGYGSLSLPRSAMGWRVVFDCAISW